MSDFADNLRKSMIDNTRRFMRMVQEMQEKDDAALREQVIRMAQEAGLGSALAHHEGELRVWIEGADWHDELARFAALVAAAEREACAKVCDEFESDADPDAGAVLAAAIRARGEEK